MLSDYAHKCLVEETIARSNDSQGPASLEHLIFTFSNETKVKKTFTFCLRVLNPFQSLTI